MSANRDQRILHIVPALFGSKGVHGGAERYALELARHMAQVAPTHLLTFGEEARTEQFGNLAVRVVGKPWYVRGQKNNPFATAIFRECAQADVIHCHQQHILASSAASAFANLFGKKVFVTDLGGGGWDVSAYLSTDRWYHGHLHISEYSRKIFGQSEKKWSHVILGGVDTEKFSPDPLVQRQDFVLYVGRLLPHKGINYLVEGMPADLPLKLVGQPMDDRFLAYLKQLGAGKQVSFHHDCGDAEIVQAYRSALCIVLPSVYRDVYGEHSNVPELLGQTLLEGTACGAPAICTDVASMPEIVEDGVCGFIVPPNDPEAIREKVVWLRNHPGEAARMGVAARNRVVEKFSWPKVVERCLEIYARG